MDLNSNYDTAERKSEVGVLVTGFMTKVYGWMCFALIVTALVAWGVANTPSAIDLIFSSSAVFYGLLIAELLLVIVITRAMNKLSAQAITFLFVIYSLLNGLTMSVIFLVFTEESIASTFAVTGITFGIMSLYGFFTKKDLSGWGNLLLMALIGLIVASVVNLFWANSMLYWITTYAGIIIFVGLTAYDTQKLKRLSVQIEEGEAMSKLSILGL